MKLMRADKKLKLLYPQLRSRHLHEALAHQLATTHDGKPLAKGTQIPLQTPLRTDALDRHLDQLKLPVFSPDIPIVFETKHWLVIDKPAGIPSHPISLFDTATITHWAFSRFATIAQEFTQIQPTITPHRLDTGTSGLLIVAKNHAGYEHWRQLFNSHLVEKTYLAWSWGTPSFSETIVNDPIDRHPSDPRKQVVSARGRNARSHIRIVKQVGDYCLCQVTTSTGVTHQVRVHLANIGLPLLGDRLYDPQYDRRRFCFGHHLLRATQILTAEHTYTLNDGFRLPEPVCTPQTDR